MRYGALGLPQIEKGPGGPWKADVVGLSLATMRRLVLAGLLALAGSAAQAEDRLFFGTSADSILQACTANTDANWGFCYGFIYAIATNLGDDKKSCAFQLMNFDPVVQTAVEALRREDKDINTLARPAIEKALIKKYPCDQ